MQLLRTVDQTFQLESEVKEITLLLVLRLIVPLKGYINFVNSNGFSDDSIAILLGMNHWEEDDDIEFNAKKVMTELRQLHAQKEQEWKESYFPDTLRQNTERMGDIIGLNDTERRLLEMFILLHSEPVLEEACEILGIISTSRLYKVLSELINKPAEQIRNALSSRGPLLYSGLVTLESHSRFNIKDRFELLSNNFTYSMMESVNDPLSFLHDVLLPCSTPFLNLTDFYPIQKNLDVLVPYLRHAVKTRQTGVNIYIYGPPGTGKSQLARVLAKELDINLFEVSREDNDGDPINGERRLRALRASQNILTNRPSLLLFDEVQDVFNNGDGLFSLSTAERHKGWINRILEDNKVPTLWLSNTSDRLDPALVRRFDMIFEVPIPNRQQRQHLILKKHHAILSPDCIARIADSDHLAPAVIERATRVVTSVQNSLTEGSASDMVEHIINNTLTTQGHQPIKKQDPASLPSWYDPDFLNSDTDLTVLRDGLQHQREGRLCLYGPPGTGKTAFARWLAEQLAMPLVLKRGSDLMSKWVGMTEKNIARAFREAESDGALLLIDEVDSFLQNRHQAQHSWEVTEVNEMLTQMESYSGLFIASTNLMTGLDSASLRRFDLKLKFDYLSPDQSWRMFTAQCAALNLCAPPTTLRKPLEQLRVLTPGDFAAVARQHRFRPLSDPHALLDALTGECALKSDYRRPIGFH